MHIDSFLFDVNFFFELSNGIFEDAVVGGTAAVVVALPRTSLEFLSDEALLLRSWLVHLVLLVEGTRARLSLLGLSKRLESIFQF